MIRHVSIFTFKDGVDPAAIGSALDLLVERVPGPRAYAYGHDLGLRAGNASFALTFDFADEAAYRAWDTDPEHERIRRELILPHLVAVQRCQMRLR